MWRMANDPFVQVETTKRLLFPTDDPPEANTLRLGTEELESELAETPRSILSTTSRHEVNIFFSAFLVLNCLFGGERLFLFPFFVFICQFGGEHDRAEIIADQGRDGAEILPDQRYGHVILHTQVLGPSSIDQNYLYLHKYFHNILIGQKNLSARQINIF